MIRKAIPAMNQSKCLLSISRFLSAMAKLLLSLNLHSTRILGPCKKKILCQLSQVKTMSLFLARFHQCLTTYHVSLKSAKTRSLTRVMTTSSWSMRLSSPGPNSMKSPLFQAQTQLHFFLFAQILKWLTKFT